MLSRCASEMFRSMSYPQLFNAVSTANKVSLVSSVIGLFASARHTGASSPKQAATTNPRTPQPRTRPRKKRLRNPSRNTGHPTALKKDRRRTPSVYGVSSRGSNAERGGRKERQNCHTPSGYHLDQQGPPTARVRVVAGATSRA